MADNKKDEQPDEDQPTVVGAPIPVPVEINRVVAYGTGREVHWARETDDDS